MGSDYRGGEGGWGGLRRLQGDRWSEVRSSSIAQSPRRGGGGAAGVLTSRNDLRSRAMGILLSERGSSRVSLFCFRICVAVCLLCLPNPRNLPTSNHFPTIFTQQQINGENENFLLLPFEQKNPEKYQNQHTVLACLMRYEHIIWQILKLLDFT